MKNIKKKIILGLFLFFLVSYLIFTVGLKIIFSVSTFFNNFKKQPTPTLESSPENFIGEINIQSIPQATNSAKFAVLGTVTNFDEITFYLNDEKIKKINISPESDFFQEIDQLIKGKNFFYAIAKNNKTKFTKKTPVYEILYKPEKPLLEIIKPSNEEKFSTNEITIYGKTEPETFVKINNLPVIVDASGYFQTTMILKNEGENKIEVLATDIAGNEEIKEIKVFYQK